MQRPVPGFRRWVTLQGLGDFFLEDFLFEVFDLGERASLSALPPILTHRPVAGLRRLPETHGLGDFLEVFFDFLLADFDELLITRLGGIFCLKLKNKKKHASEKMSYLSIDNVPLHMLSKAIDSDAYDTDFVLFEVNRPEVAKLLLTNNRYVPICEKNCHALISAIEWSKIEIAEIFIKSGLFDLNYKHISRGTAISAAVSIDSVYILKLLILHGADISMCNNYTMLHDATYSRTNTDMLKLLFDYGVSPNCSHFNKSILKDVVTMTMPSKLKCFLDNSVDISDTKFIKHALLHAPLCNIRLLLDAGMNLDILKEDNGIFTLLPLQVVQIIIWEDLDCSNVYSQFGTILVYLCQKQCLYGLDIVQSILERKKCNIRYKHNGKSALACCLPEYRKLILRYLIIDEIDRRRRITFSICRYLWNNSGKPNSCTVAYEMGDALKTMYTQDEFYLKTGMGAQKYKFYIDGLSGK